MKNRCIGASGYRCIGKKDLATKTRRKPKLTRSKKPRISVSVIPMTASNFWVTAADGTRLFVYSWIPRTGDLKAVVQIAHGLAEHSGRYARLADALNAAGYAVYANDHRGHGRTAQSEDDVGILAARNGWKKSIEDLWQLNRHIAGTHSNTPIVLLGHSMGSTMALQFICEHGDSLAGVVLSGASGKPTPLALAGRFITRLERLRLGARSHSRIAYSLSFGAFNKRFAPARTNFDWLSRDPAEVDRYVADPRCGFPVSLQLWIDLLDGWIKASSPASLRCIPQELPVYVISGSRDPVSAGCRQIKPMLDAFRAAGVRNVEHKFYPDARHELFNETNRDEVTRDLIEWMGKLPKLP